MWDKVDPVSLTRPQHPSCRVNEERARRQVSGKLKKQKAPEDLNSLSREKNNVDQAPAQKESVGRSSFTEKNRFKEKKEGR